MTKRGWWAMGAIVVLLVFPRPVQCARTGGLEGKVTAVTGVCVSGARVTARRDQDRVEFTTLTDSYGYYLFRELTAGEYEVWAEKKGFLPASPARVSVVEEQVVELNLVMEAVTGEEREKKVLRVEAEVAGGRQPDGALPPSPVRMGVPRPAVFGEYNTEEYQRIYENRFQLSLIHPLSTFSIDVDTASYANVRRYLKNNRWPPPDAVRVEEMINYFDYDFPLPAGPHPFGVYTEVGICPWNQDHQVALIGITGRKIEKIPPSNLVFLLDVSGSMRSSDKLPLIKRALWLLVENLESRDRVAIVVYSGAAGLVLPPTPGDQKEKIRQAVDQLRAGGSTAGGAGIQLAYQIALQNYIREGNNRIILATDGDFNVGVSSSSELVRMVEENRKQGVYLTVLGFGTGNYKGSRMEQLADKGDGNYYYIDSILEGKKVFTDELRGTLFTIARDVKIQVEFNPAKIKAYRLVGYENRKLSREDFSDDQKDAGELGSGHRVTALYELIPYGASEKVNGEEELKYQETRIKKAAFQSRECMTVNLRYKKPGGDRSILLSLQVPHQIASLEKMTSDFKFALAVAQFGMLLRDSEFAGSASLQKVLQMARETKGNDYFGYRAEFIQLVELARLLDREK